ncbi:MAG TPA: hypothetical protein VGD08_20095 [Stellaceae bacterium]
MRADGESKGRREFLSMTVPATATVISGNGVSAERSAPPTDADPRPRADAFGDRYAICRGNDGLIVRDAFNDGRADTVIEDPAAASERDT